MQFAFEAFVTGIVCDAGRAAFALGDGTVRWEGGQMTQAHDGAILCCQLHPSGNGVITGGDDGRLVYSRPEATTVMGEVKGGWIDALATSPESGLVAFSSGKVVRLLDSAEGKFDRRFDHSSSVSDLAFDPKGRRLAAATYGGVALWYARIAEQKPAMLRWAGSHGRVVFTPDGRFVISCMQEAVLHVWRLSDGRQAPVAADYDTKTRSMAFAQGGAWLATSGSRRAILLPLTGKDGPLDRQPLALDLEEEGVVVQVAALGSRVFMGLDSGKILSLNLETQRQVQLKTPPGPPISALAILDNDRLAWGDEAGGAGILDLPVT